MRGCINSWGWEVMARYKRILSNKKRRGKGVPFLLRGRSEIWREERGGAAKDIEG